MNHPHHPSERPAQPSEGTTLTSVRQAFLDALAGGFSRAGVLPQKIEWCLAEASSVINPLSLAQIKGVFAALCSGDGWSGAPNTRSALIESPPHLAELSAAVVRGLTRGFVGEKGLESNVLPHLEKGRHVVFVANQRFMTDSSIIAHLIGRSLPDQLVEFSCADSFPEPFSRAILQGGRSIIRTSESTSDTLVKPIEAISESPWNLLFKAMRGGHWPLLFPEALDYSAMQRWDAERQQLLMQGQGWMIPEALPFRGGAIGPLMTDVPETLGIDPARVAIIPVKVLYNGNVWHRYDLCEEIDTIVKFGRGIPLKFLHREFGRAGTRSSLREAADFLQERVLSLGSSYLD